MKKKIIFKKITIKKEKINTFMLCDLDGIPLEDYWIPYECYWIPIEKNKNIKLKK